MERRVVKSKGLNALSVDRSILYYNNEPLAVKSRALFQDRTQDIYLLMTKRLEKERVTKGLCFTVPAMFLDYWIERDPARRVVCQTQDPLVWYWLQLSNLAALRVESNTGLAYIGVQHFEVQQDPKRFVSARSLKCLTKHT